MIALSPEARIARIALIERAAEDGGPQTNGIVGVELVERAGNLYLDVEFVFALPAVPNNVRAADVSITGGVRRPSVAVASVRAEGKVLHVRVARRGDFSDYTLTIARDGAPLSGFRRRSIASRTPSSPTSRCRVRRSTISRATTRASDA